MSDERDNADAVADGTEDQSGNAGGQTAVVAPQRPTGKRSRQRALTTGDADTDSVTDAAADAGGSGTNGKAPKVKKVKDHADGPSRNPILYIVNYLKQVIAELRKVIWPNRKQMVTYTSVVLVFLAFMVALISGVDIGLARLISLVFG